MRGKKGIQQREPTCSVKLHVCKAFSYRMQLNIHTPRARCLDTLSCNIHWGVSGYFYRFSSIFKDKSMPKCTHTLGFKQEKAVRCDEHSVLSMIDIWQESTPTIHNIHVTERRTKPTTINCRTTEKCVTFKSCSQLASWLVENVPTQILSKSIQMICKEPYSC